MKKLILISGVTFYFIFLMDLYAQIPGYMLIAKNFDHPKFTGNYVSFDIYLVHTDSTRFEYAGGDFCFNFYTPVANGGILTYGILEYESDLPSNLRPIDPTVWINPGDTSQLTLSFSRFPGAGNGFIVPNNSQGIKISRMFLYTSVPTMLVRIDFPDIHMIDLRMKWRESPNLLSTKIYAYIGNSLTEITDPSRHSIDSGGLQIFPVELISFVHTVNKNKVTLNWTTASEINNSGFEVQRKVINNANDWIKTGFVHGNGTTNDLKTYYFEDRVNTGKYNYRLKQIDYNGNFEYYLLSSEVDIGNPLKIILLQNYPNPFNPVTTINYELMNTDFVSLKIFNVSGKEVSTIVHEKQIAGYYSINFDAANIPNGVYYYKITAGQYSETKKMILLK